MAWSWVRVREWIWQMIGGVRAGSRRDSRIGWERGGEGGEAGGTQRSRRFRGGAEREGEGEEEGEGESERPPPSASLTPPPLGAPAEGRGRRVGGSGWSLGWIVDWFIVCMARLRLVKNLGRGCAGWGIVERGEGRLKGGFWRTRILRTDGVVGGCFLNAEGAEITQRWQRGGELGGLFMRSMCRFGGLRLLSCRCRRRHQHGTRLPGVSPAG